MSEQSPHDDRVKQFLKWAMERSLSGEDEEEPSEEFQEIERQVRDIWANIGDFGARAEAFLDRLRVV